MKSKKMSKEEEKEREKLLEEYQKIPLKAKFYTSSGVVYESNLDDDLSAASKFHEVMKAFRDANKNKEIKYKFKDEYYLDDKQLINGSDIVGDLLKVQKDFNLSDEEIWIEIEEIQVMDDTDIIPMKTIFKPKKDPFGVFIFTPDKGKVTLEEYSDKISKKYGINQFNYTSAYCDSPTDLFVSGGKYFGQPSRDFWIIDKEKLSITKKQMPEFKFNHSMLYIPNSDIVLVVGGNSKSSFYYDIPLDKFVNCGITNELHEQPALVKYKDDVYCINALEKNKNEYFEKMNVDKYSSDFQWEKIFPKYKNDDVGKFDNKLFGASLSSNGEIVLVGGVDRDNDKSNNNFRTFTYSVPKNILDITDGSNIEVNLADKTFYKINDTHSVAIPQDFENTHQIAVLNKQKKTLRTINLSEATDEEKNSVFGLNKKKRAPGKKLNKVKTKGNIAVKGKFKKIQDNTIYKSGQYKKKVNKDVVKENKEGTFLMTSNEEKGSRVTLQTTNPKLKSQMNSLKTTLRYTRNVEENPFPPAKVERTDENEGEKPLVNGCYPLFDRQIGKNTNNDNNNGLSYYSDDDNDEENDRKKFKTLGEMLREKYKAPIIIERPRPPVKIRQINVQIIGKDDDEASVSKTKTKEEDDYKPFDNFDENEEEEEEEKIPDYLNNMIKVSNRRDAEYYLESKDEENKPLRAKKRILLPYNGFSNDDKDKSISDNKPKRNIDNLDNIKPDLDNDYIDGYPKINVYDDEYLKEKKKDLKYKDEPEVYNTFKDIISSYCGEKMPPKSRPRKKVEYNPEFFGDYKV